MVMVKKECVFCLFSFLWTLPEEGGCICEVYVLHVRFGATEHSAKTAYFDVHASTAGLGGVQSTSNLHA